MMETRKIRSSVMPKDNFRKRFLHLEFALGSHPIGPHYVHPERTSGGSEFPYLRSVGGSGDNHRYAAVGQCIYCGATERRPGSSEKLTDEHIVAEGLGGKLILPESSCDECARLTSRVELAVLRGILWAPRQHLGIQGKKRHKAKVPQAPLRAMVDGRDVTLNLPIAEHPSLLFLLQLWSPGILAGRSELDPGNWVGVWAKEVIRPIERDMRETGRSQLMSAKLDTVRFCQLLGKTAHAFAVAEVGLRNFTPYLPEQLIRRRVGDHEDWSGSYHLVGGQGARLYEPATSLHQIGLGLWNQQGRNFLIVAIRLFASLGAPEYHVVAGEMSAEQVEGLAASLDARTG